MSPAKREKVILSLLLKVLTFARQSDVHGGNTRKGRKMCFLLRHLNEKGRGHEVRRWCFGWVVDADSKIYMAQTGQQAGSRLEMGLQAKQHTSQSNCISAFQSRLLVPRWHDSTMDRHSVHAQSNCLIVTHFSRSELWHWKAELPTLCPNQIIPIPLPKKCSYFSLLLQNLRVDFF